MEFIVIFWTAFVIGLTGAMMPGPLLALELERVPREGYAAYVLLVFGHVTVEAVIVVLLAAGLLSYVDPEMMLGVISIAGGIFLLWLAFDTLRKSRTARLPESGEEAGGQVLNRKTLFLGGMISLSSPFWWAWWATVGLMLVTQSLSAGIAGAPVFYFGHITADIVWYGLVAIGLIKGRRLFSDKFYRGMILLSGLILLFFGGFFAYKGAAFAASFFI